MKNHDVIDDRCPEVRPGNWDELNRLGWRWHANVLRRLVAQNEHLLQQLQYEHGKTNVTLGEAWNPDFMRPMSDSTWVGIYLRDLNELVGRFIREFEMWWEDPC